MKHLFANVFPTQPNVKRKLITQISYKLNSCSSRCHSFMLLFPERKKIPNISHSESRKSNKIFKTSLDFNYVKPTVVLNGITKKWIAQRCVAYFWRPNYMTIPESIYHWKLWKFYYLLNPTHDYMELEQSSKWEWECASNVIKFMLNLRL